MKNKKILKILLFIVIIITVIGTIFSFYSIKTINSSLSAGFNAQASTSGEEPDIEITVDGGKMQYEYVVGDKIEIPTIAKLKGIDLENGEHPDYLDYSWCKVTGGRPSPFTFVDGQNTPTLNFDNATLNETGNYCLYVYCYRWNDNTGKYEYLRYDRQVIYAWLGYISITVLPEINVEISADKELGGSKEEGYTVNLNVGDHCKLDAKLYRYNVIRTSREENGKTIIEYKTTKDEVPVTKKFELNWTSDSNAVEVSESGYLTVHSYSANPVKITAEVTDFNGTSKTSAEVNVTISKVPVTGIEIKNGENVVNEQNPVNLKVGEHTTLTAKVSPDNATMKDVTWKVDENSKDFAEIEEATGKLTATKEGEAIIIAEAGGYTSKCKVVITKTPVTDIVADISEDVTTFLWQNYVGTSTKLHTVTIHADAMPENASDKRLHWESDKPEVASVTEIGNGNATITAGPYDSNNNTCTITVSSVDNPSVFKKFKIRVLADYNPIIIEKDSEGNVLSEGVTLVLDSKYNPDDISFKNGVAELKVGEEVDFNFTTKPVDATYESVEWSVIENDPEVQGQDVIKVNDAGLVTALSVGTAKVQVKITCQNPKCPSHHATATIKVLPIMAETVEIDGDGVVENDGKKTVDLRNHSSLTLTAKVSPDDTTDKTIKWESLNTEIATVDNEGNVTANAKGKATIKASCGSAYDICEINVTPIDIEYLEVEEPHITIKDDETNGENKLTVSYYPENADNTELVWKSSDTSILEVSEDGTLKPIKVGKAEVTVSVKDNDNVEPVTFYVNVVPAETQVTIYTVDQKGKFIPGFTLKLSKVDDEGIETVVDEIQANGKYDFGKLPNGKYIVSEVVVPEKDLAGNDLNIINSIGFFHFEVKDGEVLFVTSDESIYTQNGLVLVNIVDYPDEDESELKAYATSGIFYTNNDKTIEEQYEEFENSNFEKQPEENENPSEDDADEKDSPKTSDMPIIIYRVGMVVSLIGIIAILYRKYRKN